MGWTGTYMTGEITPKSILEHCVSQWETTRYHVLKASKVASNVYMCVEDKENHKRFVAVTFTSIDKNSLLTKEFTESAGPCAYECPQGIITLAGPIDPADDPKGYAKEWREKNRETRERNNRLATARRNHKEVAVHMNDTDFVVRAGTNSRWYVESPAKYCGYRISGQNVKRFATI